MKRKPIENPKHIGCASCTPTLTMILSKDKGFYGGFPHMCFITIDDFVYEVREEDGYFTVEELERRFGDKLKNCNFAEIQHITPLHDETYEYNTEDKNWYLVEQGQGYA